MVFNPTFYPSILPPSVLNPGQNAVYVMDPKLRSPYSWQSAIGVERQLPDKTTISVTYTYNRANHLVQTVPINAPLPGTFDPLQPLGAGNGVFPYGYEAGNIFEYESGGILKQHIVMVGFNTRFSRRISLAGHYSLTYANDLPTTPTNPYNFQQDWGRSSLDRRNNFILFGSIQAPLHLSFSPFVVMRSGAPYDVLLGEDIYGDTLTNARAAFAPSGATCGVGGVVCTSLGNFLTNYSAASQVNIVPRDYLRMAGLVFSTCASTARSASVGVTATPRPVTWAVVSAGAVFVAAGRAVEAGCAWALPEAGAAFSVGRGPPNGTL